MLALQLCNNKVVSDYILSLYLIIRKKIHIPCGVGVKLQTTIFSEDFIFLQTYKPRLVLKTTSLKQTLLYICSTGSCANVSYRYVFYVLETSV